MGRTRVHLRRIVFLFAAIALAQPPALRAQGRAGRSGAFTEIKWDVYTFKFLPGNQMAQVLDAEGHVVGTILSQGGGLQVLPTVTGDAADKLKKSFQAWKDQGGEKTLGGARLGTLSNPMTAELVHGNLTTYLDMQLLRLQPALLEDPEVLKFFALVNNCVYNTDDAPTRLNDTAVRKLMRSEFDYPQAADYYRSHAAEILSGLPRTTIATIGGAQLGQYDMTAKAFPMTVNRGLSSSTQVVKLQQRETMRAEKAITAKARGGVSGVCGDAGTQRIIIEAKKKVGSNYALDVEKEMTFTQVPVDPEEARKLVEAGWNRFVRFDGEFEILDDPKPKMVASCGNGNNVPCIVFATRVKKIAVVKPGSFPAMGKIVPDQALAVVYP
jgi:hypothetical protein